MSDQTPLTEVQRREVKQLAQLEVRQYFDYYLREVFPKQQQACLDYTDAQIQRHDDAEEAHGRVERRMNRFIWMLMGAAVTGGAGGAGLLRLLMGLSG